MKSFNFNNSNILQLFVRLVKGVLRVFENYVDFDEYPSEIWRFLKNKINILHKKYGENFLFLF